jgi:3-hydroxyacyl-[acyl-carrier-protein] dehydratase
MAPSLLLDLSQIDLNARFATTEQLEAVLPQRGHMRHVDGIIWAKEDFSETVGYKDVRDDEFWVPGHIPGRPLLPGVLMIEAAAQIAAYLTMSRIPDIGFIGFIGCENVRFRGQVTPGNRLLLLGKEVQVRPRRVICDAQGVVNGQLVFEARIIGMPI